MGNSRKAGPFGSDPFHLCPKTPGSLGVNDAGAPFAPLFMVWDTPGPLGCNDHGAVDGDIFHLGVDDLHLTISLDRDRLLWDYDPNRLLDDSLVNPKFVAAAHRALADAVRSGLRPKVHEAYRTPAESDRKHQLWKEGKGGRAASAWRSCHNYGIAMDVWLYDRKEKVIDNHSGKGWYKHFKHLAKAAVNAGFVWGENFGDGDSDHFEFHPNWAKGADGKFLLQVKKWAQQAALSLPGAGSLPNNEVGPVPEPDTAAWMPFFWWASGAGGPSPPADFLSKHPVPR